MFWSFAPSSTGESPAMTSPSRQKRTSSLILPAKLRKSTRYAGPQAEVIKTKRVPTLSFPASLSNTNRHKTSAGHRHESKRRIDTGSNSVEKLHANAMISEGSSGSSSTSCLSSQSYYSASHSSSTVQTVQSVAGSTEDDWSRVEANGAIEGHKKSRSSSLSSRMPYLSGAAPLSGASLSSSDVIHEETATVPNKSFKTVRFNEVPQVHLANTFYAERHDETKGFWYTPQEAIFMKQQPMDVLEDTLRRAISMASDKKSQRPPSRLRVCAFFTALLQELESKETFTARGLESSVRDITTGQPSFASVDTVVAAVLMEQRRLRHAARSRPFDCDRHALALAKASIRHSRRSREEALKLGHMDAMKAMEESYSRISSPREISRVEEHDNTDGGKATTEVVTSIIHTGPRHTDFSERKWRTFSETNCCSQPCTERQKDIKKFIRENKPFS